LSLSSRPSRAYSDFSGALRRKAVSAVSGLLLLLVMVWRPPQVMLLLIVLWSPLRLMFGAA
jgi:hypothetical protein